MEEQQSKQPRPIGPTLIQVRSSAPTGGEAIRSRSFALAIPRRLFLVFGGLRRKPELRDFRKILAGPGGALSTIAQSFE